MFEHSCVSAVCENNQPVMVKINQLIKKKYISHEQSLRTSRFRFSLCSRHRGGKVLHICDALGPISINTALRENYFSNTPWTDPAEQKRMNRQLYIWQTPDHWFMSTGTKHCTTESFSWIFVFTCFSRSLIHEYWNKTLQNWIILMNLCVRLLLQITDSWVLEQNTAQLNHSHESLCSPASPDHWFMSTGTKHSTTESFSWIFVFTCFSRSLIHEYWNKTLQNWIILMNLCVRLLLQITDSWVLEQNTAELNHSHESLCSPASPDHWFMSTGTKHCRTESFSWIFVFTCFSRSLIHEYWNKTLQNWIILMNLCVHLLLQITDSWVLEQNTAELNHSHESLCSPASPDHCFTLTVTLYRLIQLDTTIISQIFITKCTDTFNNFNGMR